MWNSAPNKAPVSAAEKALAAAAEKARHCAALDRQTERVLKHAPGRDWSLDPMTDTPDWELVPVECPGRANPWRLPDAWGWRFA